MKFGVIAMIDARITGKQPTFLGYDLIGKPASAKYERSKLDDFILINQGMEIEGSSKAMEDRISVAVARKKINYNIVSLFESQNKIQETATAKPQERIYNVNGKVVSKIIINGDKQQAEFIGENPEEARDIFSHLQALSAWAQLVLEKKKLEIKAELKEGTLDVTEENKLCIVKDGKVLILEDNHSVTKKQIKKTLFFLMNMYQPNAGFLKHLNCKCEEGNYIAEFKNGELSITRKDSELSTLEKTILEDLLKFQKQVSEE